MAYNPITHCKSASQTITATINAIPATPVVTPIVNCGSDNFTLSATPAEDAVCRWYATAESTDPLATGSSYGTGLIGKDSSLFVSSYNVETGCESAARAELQITIHAIPELPVAVNDTVCGSENIILQGIYDAENATTCIWYENENGGVGIDTATTYSPAETTVLYISSYNENTGCESGRAPIYAVRYEMPETPVITTTHYCDAGNYTLTPMLGAHGETIRWYNENDELINTATSLLVDLESNREYVYNISTYNATTQCESSIVSFTVPVYGVSETVETKSECVAYVWRDRTLTESNIYKDTLRNKQGCDSLIFTLNLTILDPVSYSFSATACENYTWNGSTYTVSDNYTQTFTADNGCDSVVTLLLTINPVYTHTDSKTICENELPYTYGDTTFSIGTATGEYPVTFQSVNGCDSVVTLSLTVNPTYNHEDSDIICENELPYTYGDTTFLAGTVSGEYLVKFSTINGCDSMVTLSLTVNPSYHLSDNRTICASELPYTYGGHIFPTGTVTGEYPVTFQSINGCDSVITLSLTVFPTYKPDTAHVTICQGEVHDFFGKLLDVTGIYDTTILTVHGCDSVVVLNLTVGNQTIIPIQASICKGETYTFYDMVLDEAGTYTEILTAHSGCDTIVALNLRVNPVYNQIIDTAICEGSSFFFHNKFYSQAIDTTVHYESVHGCDSIVTLKLTINYPVSTTLDPVEACNAYTWNGSTYTVSDNYVQTFTADNGCDSIVTLPLTIYNSNKTVVDTAACEEVVWDNLVFTKDTIHLIVSQGDGVCTDTLILNVTVYQPVEHILEPVSLCVGETYAENGFAFVADEAGISEKSLSLTTTQGCDSIVKLTVTIHPVPETTHIHNTICQGDSVLFAGEWRKESNIYRDTLTTIHGCDSVIFLNLTVNPSYSHTDSDVICENELPYTYGDTTFLAGTVTGEYLVAFGTVNGCDSIITLSLTVNPVYNHIDSKTICENELPYTYGNTTFPIGTGTGTGNYPVTFQSVNGCDSVVTLSLTVNPSYNHIDSKIICENELPYTYGNTTFPIGTGTGDYPITFQSVNGCDSVVTLSLTVNPAYSHTDSRTICENELPYTYGNTTFPIGTGTGDYPVTFNSVNGCDSVVTLSLTVNPSYNHIDSKIICENELPYTYGDTTFLAGTVTDEYLVAFRTVNGCDSVITLSLTINPVYNVEIDSTICQGQSVLFGGEARTSTGLYRDTLPTIHGCDSVITLNLTVNMPSATTLYDTICQGEPYTDNGFNLAEQYTLGTREHVLSDLTNAAGCDSIVTLRLTVNRVWTRNVDLSVCDSYRWNDSTYTESTTVVHIYQTTSGCDSTVTLNLTVNYSSPTHYLTDTICVNEVYNEHGFNVVYDTEGIFTESRTLTNSTGCDSTLTVTLTVMPNYSYRITDTIFAGQVYTEYGFNIVTDRPNIYRDTLYLNSEFGCDSIITLALFATPGLGTVDYQQGFTFDVYPNPTRETVTIEASTLINEIEFFDVNGRRVLCLEAIATREERCNIASFAPGIYFIRVQTEKGVLTKKLIVQ